jgi:heme/copper-type cytochrome/quinol oxidase subunit 4
MGVDHLRILVTLSRFLETSHTKEGAGQRLVMLFSVVIVLVYVQACASDWTALQ